MEIPYNRLPIDVLDGIIEEFVLREGTDYGTRAFSLEEKVAAVQKQLKDGLITVTFDPETESCSLTVKGR